MFRCLLGVFALQPEGAYFTEASNRFSFRSAANHKVLSEVDTSSGNSIGVTKLMDKYILTCYIHQIQIT